MKLKALHEDILGDLKRKLKGQVSLEKNLKRVADSAIKDAITRFETIEELLDGKESSNKSPKQLIRTGIKALQDAQKDLKRIK